MLGALGPVYSDANDVTQEVFVKVYQQLGGFRGESSFMTWLHRVTVTTCVDAHRRAMRMPRVRRPVDGDEAEQRKDLEVPDLRPGPCEALASGELGQVVRAALAKMSEKLRVVIALHDLQGMSYEDVSAVLGIPVGTVKSRLFNGRAALRAALAPYVQGEETHIDGWLARGATKQTAEPAAERLSGSAAEPASIARLRVAAGG